MLSSRGIASVSGYRDWFHLVGVVAIAILMILFIGVLNFVLDEYAKGAMRTAVDDAARRAPRPAGLCPLVYAEARQVQGGLLPGPFGAGVSVSVARTETRWCLCGGALPSLLPLVPRVYISLVGISIIAEAPNPMSSEVERGTSEGPPSHSACYWARL